MPVRKKKRKHSTPSGSMRYIRIDDAINKQKFKVHVPEGYSPTKMHPYFMELGMEPIYQPQPMNRARAVLTPVQIMFAIYDGHNIGFEKNSDVVMFVQLLELYIRKLGQFREGDRELSHHLDIMEFVINKLTPLVKNIKQNMAERDRKLGLNKIISLEEVLDAALTGV
jgi:hypothetical protein